MRPASLSSSVGMVLHNVGGVKGQNVVTTGNRHKICFKMKLCALVSVLQILYLKVNFHSV